MTDTPISQTEYNAEGIYRRLAEIPGERAAHLRQGADRTDLTAEELCEARRILYREACDEFGVELDGRTSAAEDALEHLDAARSGHLIGRWAALSDDGGAGDITYLAPFATLQEAADHLRFNATDPLYSETPRGIVDLDTGEQLTAQVQIQFRDDEGREHAPVQG